MRFSLHTTEGQRPFWWLGLLADEDDERQYELNMQYMRGFVLQIMNEIHWVFLYINPTWGVEDPWKKYIINYFSSCHLKPLHNIYKIRKYI